MCSSLVFKKINLSMFNQFTRLLRPVTPNSFPTLPISTSSGSSSNASGKSVSIPTRVSWILAAP